MDIKEVKDIVNGMELSPEALAKVDEILSDYKEGETIPDGVIDKILAIVDLEIDATKLAADIYKSGAELADEFLTKVDDESEKINDEINSVL